MDGKQLGAIIAGIGLAGVFYEYFASDCLRRLPGICYFPFSPGNVLHGLPLYSAFILAVGMLLYLSPQESKDGEEPGE